MPFRLFHQGPDPDGDETQTRENLDAFRGDELGDLAPEHHHEQATEGQRARGGGEHAPLVKIAVGGEQQRRHLSLVPQLRQKYT